MSDAFPIQNGLKQENNSLHLLLNFASDYAFKKIQENQKGLEIYGIYQSLFYADDINKLGEKINNKMKKQKHC
jgi:hypothetical protein